MVPALVSTASPCLQREQDRKNFLTVQSTLIDQMTVDLDNEKLAHSVDMETLQSQCNTREQACTARQNELEAQLKITQQALEAARTNQTAIIKEWMDKPFTWQGGEYCGDTLKLSSFQKGRRHYYQCNKARGCVAKYSVPSLPVS
jgi:hypothetical protein